MLDERTNVLKWPRSHDSSRQLSNPSICSTNACIYSAAISACSKGGCWERALGLLEEMHAVSLEPDVVSYNAAISACAKGKQWASALSLLDRMRLEVTGSAFPPTCHGLPA